MWWPWWPPLAQPVPSGERSEWAPPPPQWWRRRSPAPAAPGWAPRTPWWRTRTDRTSAVWSVGTRVVANTTGSTPVKVGTMIAVIIYLAFCHSWCHGLLLNSPCENINKNVISKRKILCEVFSTHSPPQYHSQFLFQLVIWLQTFEGDTPLKIRVAGDVPQ